MISNYSVGSDFRAFEAIDDTIFTNCRRSSSIERYSASDKIPP